MLAGVNYELNWPRAAKLSKVGGETYVPHLLMHVMSRPCHVVTSENAYIACSCGVHVHALYHTHHVHEDIHTHWRA